MLLAKVSTCYSFILALCYVFAMQIAAIVVLRSGRSGVASGRRAIDSDVARACVEERKTQPLCSEVSSLIPQPATLLSFCALS